MTFCLLQMMYVNTLCLYIVHITFLLIDIFTFLESFPEATILEYKESARKRVFFWFFCNILKMNYIQVSCF